MKAWWFGCATPPASKGHYLHPNQAPYYGPEAAKVEASFPFDADTLDGGFAPREKPISWARKGEQVAQGLARLTHVGGWTVLSFWDSSGDARGGSNTSFIFDKYLTAEEVLLAARATFPELFARFPFEVKIVETKEIEEGAHHG